MILFKAKGLRGQTTFFIASLKPNVALLKMIPTHMKRKEMVKIQFHFYLNQYFAPVFFVNAVYIDTDEWIWISQLFTYLPGALLLNVIILSIIFHRYGMLSSVPMIVLISVNRYCIYVLYVIVRSYRMDRHEDSFVFEFIIWFILMHNSNSQ